MSVIMKLKTVRDALKDVCNNVYHYEADTKSNTYIVWAEDGEGDSRHLDNCKEHQVISGTIDLFTIEEYSKLIDDIQAGLSKAGISFVLNSVQYESDTHYIHYEWRFEI